MSDTITEFEMVLGSVGRRTGTLKSTTRLCSKLGSSFSRTVALAICRDALLPLCSAVNG